MHLTRLAPLVLLLLVQGCGNGGSGSPCPAFFGSCSATGGGSCVDYGGNLDKAATQDACTTQGGAAWSTSPCNKSAFVGACVFNVGNVCSAQWYGAPFTAAAAEEACVAGGGTFTPP